MSHLFGDLIAQHLHRKHGLSQSRLAAGIRQEPAIISRMCRGERLTGPQARERVLAIIGWLHQQGALDTPDEANALLTAAGLAPLRETEHVEAALLHQLRNRSSAAPETLTPAQLSIAPEFELVGRPTEWHTLRTIWQTATRGKAHLVTIAGEAGIGKTRLAEELLAEAQQHGHRVVRTRAYAMEGRLAYAPLADWLRSPALAASVSTLSAVWRGELARVLPELLIADPALPAPQPLAERWQLKRLLEALLQAFSIAHSPLVLVLDDLQWCDAETLEWLQYALGAAPHLKLLIVGTVRDTDIDPEHPLHKLWHRLMRDGQLTTISLAPLSQTATAQLGAAVAQHALSAESAQALFQDCAGNPLFVIESIRSQQTERCNGQKALTTTLTPLPTTALPPKVYAVIQSRLAQLSPAAREIAKVAAVIGRAFTLALLTQASARDEVTVVQALDELWRRRLLREQDAAHYDFSHDRIRDVAYAETSPVRRRALHRIVAETIEGQQAEQLDEVAAQLATHYEAAGVVDLALVWVLRAIAWSQVISATHSELAQINQGLRMIQLLPETEPTIRQKIEFLNRQGDCQAACTSWIDSRAQEAHKQVLLLGQKINDPYWIYIGQTCLRFYLSLRAEWAQTQVVAEHNVVLAEALAERDQLEDAYHALGRVHFYRGHLVDARHWYEKTIAVATESTSSPAAFTHLNYAHCLCLLGYPDQASQHATQGIKRAQQVTQFETAAGLHFDVILNHMTRNFIAFQRANQLMQQLAQQYEFPFYIQMAELFAGYDRVRQGQSQAGLEKIKNSIAYFEADGHRMFYAHMLGLHIEACLIAGQYAQSLAFCEKALAFVAHTDDTFWAPELHRLKGIAFLKQTADVGEVETSFCIAIEQARSQNSKWLELRAAMSLARLWQQQNKRAQAHQLLAPIYQWFTEGFDTPDLKEARILLAELA